MPERPYPTAPWLVWMLAGMNVDKGAAVVGASEVAVVLPAAGAAGGGTFQMTAAGTPYEHLMMHFSAEDVAAVMQGGKFP